MAGYKGPHISASPYDRQQFTRYPQYPSVDVAMGYGATGGVQYPGQVTQGYDPNFYPNYYATAGFPCHTAVSVSGADYAGEAPVFKVPYPPPVVTQRQVTHKSFSSTHVMVHHQSVNPTYLQVSGDSPQQQHVEVTSQAQQQHYQQQYQAASNQAM